MFKGLVIGLVAGIVSSTWVAQAFFVQPRSPAAPSEEPGTSGVAPLRPAPAQYLPSVAGGYDTVPLQAIGGFAILSGAPGGLKISGAPLLLDPGQSIVVGGAPVLGQRVTGFTPASGTAKRAGFDADYTQVIAPRYSQLQVQALQNLVVQTRQELKALRDALSSHGLIGP